MVDDLSQLVRSFAGRRILLVGDLILDRYTYGDAERISPEAPVPVLRVVERREAVGGSANVAACLRALGCRTVCCGVVGQDRHGETLIDLLEDIDVDTAGVVRLSDRPTTTKTRLVGLAQHRHRQQLLRVDEEEIGALPAKTATSLAKKAAQLVAACDVVCIEDYDKGLIRESLVHSLVAEAKRKGVPVLVDPARLSEYERYRGVDLITPNREELSIATGKRLDASHTAGFDPKRTPLSGAHPSHDGARGVTPFHPAPKIEDRRWKSWGERDYGLYDPGQRGPR